MTQAFVLGNGVSRQGLDLAVLRRHRLSLSRPWISWLRASLFAPPRRLMGVLAVAVKQ